MSRMPTDINSSPRQERFSVRCKTEKRLSLGYMTELCNQLGTLRGFFDAVSTMGVSAR